MVVGEKKKNGMRIGIDCRLWNQTGVGRYIRNLVYNLVEIDKENEYILFARKEDNLKLEIQNSKFKICEIDIPWHSLSEQFRFSGVINKENLDLMHFTYFSLPITYGGKYVLTIHDLILHHFSTGNASTKPFPIFFFKQFFYRKIIERSAKKAISIIAVSKATKSEIVDHLKVGDEKIKVIYEGIDIEKGNKRSKFEFPYLLYVGNTYPHKNPKILIKVIEGLSGDYPDLKLVMVSKDDYFYKKLISDLNSNNLSRIILKENITDAELSDLYANAKALVIPSFMEGFGLPILEAMKSNCLVLCSDIPVFREIAKDAAIYFDPKSLPDLSEKIKLVFSQDNSQKSKYITLGETIVKSFSWKKMTEETLKVYESSFSL